MSEGRGRFRLAPLLGTLSVVASLALVAWEVSQNTIAVRAATYDRLAEASSVYLWEIARDPELAALFDRVFKGGSSDAFDQVEGTRVGAVVLAFLTHLENSYRQYQAGVIGDDVFLSYGWNDGLLKSEFFRQRYDRENLTVFFNEDFVDYLLAHVETIRPQGD